MWAPTFRRNVLLHPSEPDEVVKITDKAKKRTWRVCVCVCVSADKLFGYWELEMNCYSNCEWKMETS
jgi:hypothetical protein